MAMPIPSRVLREGSTIAASRAFTLVELMVTMVIITILASLSLAGMAGARQRAKIEKTKSTIRKIDSVIRPMYESYRMRRVSVTATTDARANARSVLRAKRDLMLMEMPDTPTDVTTTSGFSSMPGYITYRSGKTSDNGSAECLYMILARSGFDPDALESFRAEEIGDKDADGAPEFIDGWGNPIIFLRWAPGWLGAAYTSLQVADTVNSHDPLDPLKVDSTAYALVPLIASGGPDGLTGLTVVSSGWIANRPLTTLIVFDSSSPPRLIGSPDSSTPPASIDNITNHDLLKK